ncbi:MAG: hypothetical protein K0R08_1896 [Solimicrobium sp.]|nr:hypothetical protein [Solimicrobium sp.]
MQRRTMPLFDAQRSPFHKGPCERTPKRVRSGLSRFPKVPFQMFFKLSDHRIHINITITFFKIAFASKHNMQPGVR